MNAYGMAGAPSTAETPPTELQASIEPETVSGLKIMAQLQAYQVRQPHCEVRATRLWSLRLQTKANLINASSV